MSALSGGLDPHFEVYALSEVRKFASVTGPWGRKFRFRLTNPAQCPLDPWTFLLDE
jgi:hypothetical protein